MGLRSWLGRRLSTPWHFKDEWEPIVTEKLRYAVVGETGEAWELRAVWVDIYRHVENGRVKAHISPMPRTPTEMVFKDEFEEDPWHEQRDSDVFVLHFKQNAGSIFRTWDRPVDQHFISLLAYHEVTAVDVDGIDPMCIGDE